MHLSCYVPVQWLKHNAGELRLESRYVPVRVLEPQRWRAAIRGAHVQIVSELRVSAPESQCSCSMAQTTTVTSYDLRVVMYLFGCSSHKGGELRSGVPMSRLSLSQRSAHLSRNVPIRGLWPQWWRVAIKGAHVQIVSEPRVSALEPQCPYLRVTATIVVSSDQGCPCPDCL